MFGLVTLALRLGRYVDLLQGTSTEWSMPTTIVGKNAYSSLLYADLTTDVIQKHGVYSYSYADTDDDLGSSPSSSPAYIHLAFQVGPTHIPKDRHAVGRVRASGVRRQVDV